MRRRDGLAFLIMKRIAACGLWGIIALAGQTKLPDGPGKDSVLKICNDCHAVEVLQGVGKSKEGWAATVDDMVAKGATGSDEEVQQIVEYLARNFGKVNINTATMTDLKEKLDLPVKEAQAILDYRQEHGSFKSWADLKKVPDVDLARLEAKKGKITF